MSTEVTHRIEIPTRITALCDKEQSARFALHSVKAIEASGNSGVWLAATNGRAAAIVQTAGICPTPVQIPMDIATLNGSKCNKVALNGTWENLKGKMTKPLDPNLRFPKLDSVLQGFEITEETPAMMMNLSILENLGKACTNGTQEPCVMLFYVREVDKKGNVSGKIVVVGEGGVGIMLSIETDNKTIKRHRDWYTRQVKQYCEDEECSRTGQKPVAVAEPEPQVDDEEEFDAVEEAVQDSLNDYAAIEAQRELTPREKILKRVAELKAKAG